MLHICSAFSRKIHVALCRRVMFWNRCSDRVFMVTFGRRNHGKVGTSTGGITRESRTGHKGDQEAPTTPRQDSIFPGLKARKECVTEDKEWNREAYNYYSIRDGREKVPSPGFEQWDPRSRMSNRDDVTEEMELDLPREEVAGDPIAGVPTVELTNICVVTRRAIKAEVPVNQLTGRDVVSAIMCNVPELAGCPTFENLYHSCNRHDGGPLTSGAEVLRLLEKHICLLGRTRLLKAREAVTVALVYDAHGLLDAELGDSLVGACQSQLYAFRPYDIAAAVAVFGKQGSRYNALLNTLGLVFYDHMIAGETSICPEGASLEETIAVLEAYARVEFPVKRVIDAGFGKVYEQMGELSSAQKISILDSFFRVSRDSNFVEMYTRILADLFGEPLLFVCKFQQWAQEKLQTGVNEGMGAEKGFNASSKHVPEAWSGLPAQEFFRVMGPMSSIRSEYLIQAVHSRVAFKRLWTDNIERGIMPWQGPVVPPGDARAEVQSSLAPKSEKLDTHMIVTGVAQEVDAAIEHQQVVSYRELLPGLYATMRRLIAGNIGQIRASLEDLRSVHDGNNAVMEIARSIAMEQEVTLPETLRVPCYPFLATMHYCLESCRTVDSGYRSAIGTALPMGKVDINRKGEPIVTDDAVKWHARRLVDLGVKAPMLEPFGMDPVDSEDLRREALHCLSTGNSNSSCDGFPSELGPNILANAISVICDYSRYVEEDHRDTVDLLGALYFRLLFCGLPEMVTGPGKRTEAIKRFFERVAPMSLVWECPYLPLTENRVMMGETDFYWVAPSRYEFYRPSPVYADIFKGNSGLYGLVLYCVAQKIQYLSFQQVEHDRSDSGIEVVSKVLQHLLHPFYVARTLSSTAMARWDMLYYLCALNKGHDLVKVIDIKSLTSGQCSNEEENRGKRSDDEVEAAVQDEDRLDFVKPKSNCGGLNQQIDALLDMASAQGQEAIRKVTSCEHFRHAANVLINVSISYLQSVVAPVENESLGLIRTAELSLLVSMLIEFQMWVNQEDVSHLDGMLTQLRDQLTELMCQEISEMSRNLKRREFDCISLSDEKERERPYSVDKGIPERVENLNEQIDSETFIRVIHALSLASKGEDDAKELIDSLHLMTQVMYQRMQYMNHNELVKVARILVELSGATRYAIELDVEDPRGQLAQMVRILRNRLLEVMDCPVAQTDDEYILKPLGRWELQKLVC